MFKKRSWPATFNRRQSRQCVVSAIMVTHWYMARKNPAPTAKANSAFLVSDIITPQRKKAPSAGTRALDLGHIVVSYAVRPLRLPEPYLRLTTLLVAVAQGDHPANITSAPELVTSIRIVCGKGEGRMSWSWRDLVVLTFFVLLFGAAMMANVSDGPMHEYRGAWVSRASR
jgi:hypothetical protein